MQPKAFLERKLREGRFWKAEGGGTIGIPHAIFARRAPRAVAPCLQPAAVADGSGRQRGGGRRGWRRRWVGHQQLNGAPARQITQVV